MKEFQWGDPPPLPVDLKKEEDEFLRDIARHFVNKLSEAHRLSRRKEKGTAECLEVFDEEAVNIRWSQDWASQRFAANQNDKFVAELCRDFPLSASDAIDLRLQSTERIRWLEVSIEACRKLGDLPNEGIEVDPKYWTKKGHSLATLHPVVVTAILHT